MLGDSCDPALGNPQAWRKIIECANGSLLEDSLFVASHIGIGGKNESISKDLNDIAAQRSTEIIARELATFREYARLASLRRSNP